MACGYVPAPDRFASGLLSYLDCQAASLGAQGYGALASPGSTASVLMLVLLTIFIALVGYRLLLGDAPTLREGVLSFVKLGIVLALATSWPAYQVLIYDVALRAPGELAAEVGGASGLPGAGGGLAARLDGVDQGLRTLSILGVGNPTIDINATDPAQRVEPALWAGFDTFALGASRIVFLGTAAGGFGLVRLVAGFLLALGPLFVAFLLFAGTRGLFEGWLRVLIGAALGAFVTNVLLAIELALLEPWVADLVMRRGAGEAISGIPAALFSTVLIFAGILIGLIVAATRVGSGLRLATFTPASQQAGGGDRRIAPLRDTAGGVVVTGGVSADGRSRAAGVADAIISAQRREEQQTAAEGLSAATRGGAVGGPPGRGATAMPGAEPLGQRFRRRTTTRISASSRVRDRRA